MKELQQGKMSSKDLAIWFGIKYTSYNNSRRKKLEELKEFCEYEEVYGGINILEVYQPIYIKGWSINDDRIYTQAILDTGNNLATLSGIVRMLQATYEEYAQVPYGTLYNRIRKAGIRGYGNTLDEDSVGLYGKRKPVWAIKVSDLNEYRFMTLAEQEIYKNLLSKADEDGKALEKCAWAAEAIDNEGKIEDVKEMLKQQYNVFYSKVIRPFYDKTGGILVRATEYEVFKSQIEKLLQIEVEKIQKEIIEQGKQGEISFENYGQKGLKYSFENSGIV